MRGLGDRQRAIRPEGPFHACQKRTRRCRPRISHGTPGRDVLRGTNPASRGWSTRTSGCRKIDGTMEAIAADRGCLPALPDAPIYLFKASGRAVAGMSRRPASAPREADYVTDGPELFRTKDGSSADAVVQLRHRTAATWKRSRARNPANSKGPREQLAGQLIRRDSGHWDAVSHVRRAADAGVASSRSTTRAKLL